MPFSLSSGLSSEKGGFAENCKPAGVGKFLRNPDNGFVEGTGRFPPGSIFLNLMARKLLYHRDRRNPKDLSGPDLLHPGGLTLFR
jgi:hypothetical protein